MSKAKVHPPHRRLRLELIAMGVIIAVSFGAYHWLVSTAQATLRQRLTERGLNLTSSSESWSLFGGIALNNAALRGLPDNEPLIEISALHVDILWREVWKTRKAVTRWHITDGTLTLHDSDGAVSFEHFTTELSVLDDKIEIAQLETINGPVSIAVSGEILTAKASPDTPHQTEAFKLRLKPVRSVMNMLSFKPGGGTFAITGSFTVDLQADAAKWTAKLHGSGPKLELHGVPMKKAEVDAQISQSDLNLTSKIAFAKGSAAVEASLSGWQDQPLLLSGTLTDTAGRKDTFKGKRVSKTDTLTISRLSGDANLLELALNIPVLAAGLPKDVKVTTFPDIIAEDFVLRSGSQPPTWTLGSMRIRSAAALIVTVREHPLVITHLQGSVSYDHRAWHFESLKGKMLGGEFALVASFDGKKLSGDVALQTLHLDTLTPWVGKLSTKLENAQMTLTYRGVIGDDPSNSTGTGTLDLTDAPIVHVPLLDQAYQLFPKILNRESARDTGEVRTTFIMKNGVAMVEPMKVLGQSIVVTARGTVDLNKRTVEGHGRANIRGVVGVIISPISVVFMEMQVKGPFDDIKVAPLGLIGAAKSVLKNAAKLSSIVLREGVSVPFEALGMFRRQNTREGVKAGE
ncbi:MAG: AsmA-like C-terminal region-containing protein [Prosthecobacter sp.]|nr:AsmA-like C-terminal region-containing protein [Prosthecobacter sp.]